jgi:hypothetical protein
MPYVSTDRDRAVSSFQFVSHNINHACHGISAKYYFTLKLKILLHITCVLIRLETGYFE